MTVVALVAAVADARPWLVVWIVSTFTSRHKTSANRVFVSHAFNQRERWSLLKDLTNNGLPTLSFFLLTDASSRSLCFAG